MVILDPKNEFRETRVIRCSLGPLPGPEKVPLFGADCTKFASLAVMASEWREICSVREQYSLIHLIQGKLLFMCGLHKICITRGGCWRMARNLLSSRAILSCLQN